MNVEEIRNDFPVLEKAHYLDTACMALRPKQVIDKIKEYYSEYPACGGRAYHSLGKRVTEEVDNARMIIKDFISAKKDNEIVFSKNATESINLVAHSLDFKKGDVVLTLDKEHNSNLLPWIRLKEKGVLHDVVNTNADNTFSLEELDKKLEEHRGKVKLCAFGWTSNLDGVSIPAKGVVNRCHKAGALVLLDGAQTVPHHPVDVRKVDVDFLAFSGHKMCGPSGIGVLYGKEKLLKELKPFIFGGETVIDSKYDGFSLEELPMRLEAGLQHYAGIIGLGEACKYLSKVGMKNIAKHELELNELLTTKLASLDAVELIGPEDPKSRGSIFNIILKGMDAHEAAIILDQSKKVMVRSGAHCVHSWFNARNKKPSLRASLYFYNDENDVKEFISGIKDLLEMR